MSVRLSFCVMDGWKTLGYIAVDTHRNNIASLLYAINCLDNEYNSWNLDNGDDPCHHHNQVGRLPVVSKTSSNDTEGRVAKYSDGSNLNRCCFYGSIHSLFIMRRGYSNL